MVPNKISIIFQIFFLSCLSSMCGAIRIPSCIRIETYQATQYQMKPIEFSDGFFSHGLRFLPRKLTKVGLRSRRLVGCCDPGFQYQGSPSYSCKPICSGGCPSNSHCSEPNKCVCDSGFRQNSGLECVTIEIASTSERSTPTQIALESRVPKIPCNDSCPTNEICSLLDDVCICRDGFQRSNESSICEPQCDQTCQNSDCSSPNTCTCWPHYERTNNTSCHIKCTELTCIFGECDSNGMCVCAQGFFNNGTDCVWAGEDSLSEPDFCDCWAKYVWQQNVTERRCRHLCDGDDSIEMTSECIPFKDCQCYEGYLICHSQIYKCVELEQPSSTPSTEVSYQAVKVTDERKSSFLMLLMIAIFLILILFVGAILYVYEKRRAWFNRLWSYNEMGSDQI